MIDDAQLLAQLKRWYQEDPDQEDVESHTLTFGEAFLGEKWRGKFVQKPLKALLVEDAQVVPGTTSRRSTLGVECIVA